MANEVKLKPFKLSFEFYDPDEVDEFLRGAILASQNNNSSIFRDIIDGINGAMENYRADKLKAEMSARAAAGMP